MKAVSLDSWAFDGKVFKFQKEYDISDDLFKRFPSKWKVTSELKTEIIMESGDCSPLPKKRGRPKR